MASSATVNAGAGTAWWTQAAAVAARGAAPARPASHPRPPSPTRPGAAPRTGDSVSVSARRPVDRDAILAQVRARISSVGRGALDALSRGGAAVGRGASGLIQGFSDFVGGGLRALGRGAGALTGMVTRGASRLVAGGLDLVGAPEAANRVRSAGQTASRVLERTLSAGGDAVGNFVSGVGDGAAGLVEGVVTAVTNPVQTVQALGRIANAVNPVMMVSEAVQGRDPLGAARELVGGIVDGIKEDYARTGRDHGAAGQGGRLVFDVATTLLTGGSTAAGRVGTRAVVNTVDDIARVARATEEAGRVARLAGGVADDVAGAARTTASGVEGVSGARRAVGEFIGGQAHGPLGGVAKRVTSAAENVVEALSQRNQQQMRVNVERGQARAATSGVRGADGAEILKSARSSANRLSDDLKSLRRRWGEAAERDGLIESLPGPTQQRVRELQQAGKADDALEVIQRHHVDEAVRSSLDDAGRVDELYPLRELPSDVDPSRVLAQGRRDSLEYMLNDPSLSADGLRRNFRHIVDDSDIPSPVYIQQYRAGDQVGRAFSSSAGRQTGIGSKSAMNGGYYGSVDDVNLSRSQIQARNAIERDNHADKFATFTIPEDTYGVVTRIGEKYSFGEHAVGGNIQVTFPGRVQPANPAVTDVGRLSRRDQAILDGVAASGATGEYLLPEEDQ